MLATLPIEKVTWMYHSQEFCVKYADGSFQCVSYAEYFTQNETNTDAERFAFAYAILNPNKWVVA